MPGGAIAVASDHAGFDLKEILKRDLQEALAYLERMSKEHG